MTQLYFSIGSSLGAPTVPPEAYGQLLPYTDHACKENTQPLSHSLNPFHIKDFE